MSQDTVYFPNGVTEMASTLRGIQARPNFKSVSRRNQNVQGAKITGVVDFCL
jgi:hypothetical protein